jgi:hypothetical protein
MFAGILEIVVHDQGGVVWQRLVCPSASTLLFNVNVLDTRIPSFLAFAQQISRQLSTLAFSHAAVETI